MCRCVQEIKSQVAEMLNLRLGHAPADERGRVTPRKQMSSRSAPRPSSLLATVVTGCRLSRAEGGGDRLQTPIHMQYTSHLLYLRTYRVALSLDAYRVIVGR
jgi:hypothetical protein